MGLIKKIKDIFIEEDEMDKTKDYTKEFEVKKKIEIENEDTEIELETTITERELYKSPSTFKFPVIFEEDLSPKKEDTQRKYIEKEKKNDEEETRFKASPIISPVYGILDKNYNKDEINNKSDKPEYESKRKKVINVDIIRQKAFGTLEDDLESTIMNDNNFIYGLKENEEETKENPIAEEMGLTEKVKEDVSIEKAYEDYNDFGLEYKANEEHEEEKNEKTEVLDEDLFNLINSMYKNEENEEEEDE